MKSTDGSLQTTEADQIEKWRACFESLLNKAPVTAVHSSIEPARQRNFTTTPPTYYTIIRQLKSGKAPGADNIAAEMLQVDVPKKIADLLNPIMYGD